MKLEDQVVNLELSKRLKELGVKQESHFYWTKERDGEFWIRPYSSPGYSLQGIRENIGDSCSAFTCSELGEMLPEWTMSYKYLDKFRCLYDGPIPSDKFAMETSFDEKTEADARARMVQYLIEQGLVKP